jgi:cold shock CspA family protein
MTGRIEIFRNGGTSGVIKAENGLTVPFEASAVMAYDVASLAEGQLVTFELESGRARKAINVCVEKVAPRADHKSHESLRLRYTGFEQKGSIRAFRFERVAPGERTKTCTVDADMALFTKHRVGIQDGPALCLRLLEELNAARAADLPLSGCSLTDRDMLAHVASRPVPRPRPRPRHMLGASAAASHGAAPLSGSRISY